MQAHAAPKHKAYNVAEDFETQRLHFIAWLGRTQINCDSSGFTLLTLTQFVVACGHEMVAKLARRVVFGASGSKGLRTGKKTVKIHLDVSMGGSGQATLKAIARITQKTTAHRNW